ncbi:hypothetical protein [uncultured Methanobrevibacter sp.]|uniref:hypothetical protein n=1 Tax=uncultured Methanobrevibacter sp. TaxID=253161 RepID=UPI0025F8B5BA|nr:hypothetical protein [uncultured Methanobrevibacter sp.]
MNSKYSICITVYKNRRNKLLKYLPNVDKKYDIYIVAQENDPSKDEYEQYCTQDNIKYLICDAKNLEEKRQYILTKMRELKYNGFFILDDDIVPEGCCKVEKNVKRTTSDALLKQKCSMNELLDVCITRSNKYNIGICGFINKAFMGYSRVRECVINKTFTQYCFVYFNLDIFPPYIDYDVSGSIHADIDIVCKSLQIGINIGTIETHSYDFVYGGTTLKVDGQDLEFKYKCGTAYKWHIPMWCRTAKKTELGFKVYLRFKPELYFNTKTLPQIEDITLYNYCKKQEYNEAFNYLKEIYENKHNKNTYIKRNKSKSLF